MQVPPVRLTWTLDTGATAEYIPSVVAPSDVATASAMATAAAFPPTPLTRFKTILKRRQGFYTDLPTTAYAFGAQKVPKAGSISGAPAAIRLCFADALERAAAAGEPLPNVAHVNYYSDGSAGISGHQDTETVDGSSIYSYTLLCGPPRTFLVADTASLASPQVSIELGHGSLFRMSGKTFQQNWYHGIKPTRRKSFATAQRLNVTVRAWPTGNAAPLTIK